MSVLAKLYWIVSILSNIIILPLFIKVVYEHNQIDKWPQIIANLSESNINTRDIGVVYTTVVIDTTATVNNNTIKLRLEYPPPPQALNIKSDTDINRWLSAMRSPTNVFVSTIPSDLNTYQAYSEPVVVGSWIFWISTLLLQDIIQIALLIYPKIKARAMAGNKPNPFLDPPLLSVQVEQTV